MTRPRTKSEKAARRFERARQQQRRSYVRLGLFAAGLAVVISAFVIFEPEVPSDEAKQGSTAPAFELASTEGDRVSLGDYEGQDVLLYFSEGVGCDACWYQMVELEKHAAHLERDELTMVPVVPNPVDDAKAEMERFGIITPFLSDPDTAVSAAYGTLGKGHHANLPGHSFVLVDGDGNIAWRKDYSTMFVEPADLLEEVDEARG
ncbi:MAG: redoxin domain-containing protein [Actinobacteria bacterium]|nr:redoxin domain-containing protein [Actinomycetota bacterium]